MPGVVAVLIINASDIISITFRIVSFNKQTACRKQGRRYGNCRVYINKTPFSLRNSCGLFQSGQEVVQATLPHNDYFQCGHPFSEDTTAKL